MWRRSVSIWSRRRFSTAGRIFPAKDDVKDEGDWSYSSEWWAPDNSGHSVFRSASDRGNGVVSVVAFPSSTPNAVYWPRTEKWLQQRYAGLLPGHEQNERFRVLGYQWRVLRFNDDTRQSTVKLMVAYRESDPESVFFMPQAHCLAVPYLKSVISAGFTALTSCGYELMKAARGEKPMHILCIGHGGGSLPLFLASKIQGAVVHIVEIDPLVITASVKAMGFPSFSIMSSSGERALSKPSFNDEVLWNGTHERLFLYESDAEDFIANSTNLYDMVFIDAYDGEDIFPRNLWDPQSPFLKALGDQLHPEHGTVVVNLHSDYDVENADRSIPGSLQSILPMGKYVSSVSQAYKDVLLRNIGDLNGKKNRGVGFTVPAPYVCNTSLVVSRGFGGRGGTLDRDSVMNILMSKCIEVEDALELPFSCLEYVKRGLILVD